MYAPVAAAVGDQENQPHSVLHQISLQNMCLSFSLWFGLPYGAAAFFLTTNVPSRIKKKKGRARIRDTDSFTCIASMHTYRYTFVKILTLK